MELVIIIGLLAVIILFNLLTGNRRVRGEDRFGQWRITGKGMLNDYDAESREVDKFMR